MKPLEGHITFSKALRFETDNQQIETADIYTHTSAEAEREAAVALEGAIYSELFAVVPNFGNANNSAPLNYGQKSLRLYP